MFNGPQTLTMKKAYKKIDLQTLKNKDRAGTPAFPNQTGAEPTAGIWPSLLTYAPIILSLAGVGVLILISKRK